MNVLTVVSLCLLLAALLALAMAAGECRYLKEALRQARADRAAAYNRGAEMHAAYIADVQANAARLTSLADRLRAMTDSPTVARNGHTTNREEN